MAKPTQQERHLAILMNSDLHKNGACVMSHGSKPKNSPCDYQINGYKISLSRKEMYNDKDVSRLSRAGALYELFKRFVWRVDPNWDRFHEWRAHLNNSATLLEDDERAWNIDEIADVDKGLNFLPSEHGGEGMFYPYVHNWHHMIPNIAPYKFITDDGDTRGLWRLRVLMEAGYNLNCEENVVLLPMEYHVARVLGLPVHCPYSIPDHRGYTAALKGRMLQIRNMLDAAVTRSGCTIDPAQGQAAKKAMNSLSSALLSMIKVLWQGDSAMTYLDDMPPLYGP